MALDDLRAAFPTMTWLLVFEPNCLWFKVGAKPVVNGARTASVTRVVNFILFSIKSWVICWIMVMIMYVGSTVLYGSFSLHINNCYCCCPSSSSPSSSCPYVWTRVLSDVWCSYSSVSRCRIKYSVYVLLLLLLVFIHASIFSSSDDDDDNDWVMFYYLLSTTDEDNECPLYFLPLWNTSTHKKRLFRGGKGACVYIIMFIIIIICNSGWVPYFESLLSQFNISLSKCNYPTTSYYYHVFDK